MGLYPAITLADARQRRDEAKKLLAHGINPSAERKATQAAKFASESGRFEIVAREWFSKFQTQWAESHAKVNMQRLERDVSPWLGDRPEISNQQTLYPLEQLCFPESLSGFAR
ncbi:integrase arm-type DNA-binding domain-containing protein [Thermosynechococcaceae cyanobacterium BACA0444]|uniref:Integrase arm-type DNA-binding domain-containing protein n=1 Tax=Pseudocalidococcus azoricus BACA0444 TaxID=2918990 RepID=A0AAE4FQD1_9CYAN|nr:integrase arm-type DNA-binding domain-containing protein [Pseudocalidococcus azoricus BACA0444]